MATFYLPTRSRPLRVVTVVLLCVFGLISYVWLKNRPSYDIYHAMSDIELDRSRRFIRNTWDSKYVMFKQLQGAGFNNQAQEILLFHHLALLSSRVYMYQPLVWRPRGEKATVPLSSFLRGVIRNSVSSVVFDEACPAEHTKHVRLRVNHDSQWQHAVQALSGKEKCIVVDDWILNWDYLASPALHDVWPSFKAYLNNHFEWSGSIDGIAHRAQRELNLRPDSKSGEGEPYIAIHLRRGDFEGHCHSLAADRSGFTTWATLPVLQPSIYPPALDTSNATSVLEHCYPSLKRIISVIDYIARAKPHLRTLHVLHDGAWDHPLVYWQNYKLEAALRNPLRATEAGWENGPMRRVTHSGNVPLRWGEGDWAVAADVELARRAEVFVGNGYSSLSSQVVALRLGADSGRAEDIFFV